MREEISYFMGRPSSFSRGGRTSEGVNLPRSSFLAKAQASSTCLYRLFFLLLRTATPYVSPDVCSDVLIMLRIAASTRLSETRLVELTKMREGYGQRKIRLRRISVCPNRSAIGPRSTRLLPSPAPALLGGL